MGEYCFWVRYMGRSVVPSDKDQNVPRWSRYPRYIMIKVNDVKMLKSFFGVNSAHIQFTVQTTVFQFRGQVFGDLCFKTQIQQDYWETVKTFRTDQQRYRITPLIFGPNTYQQDKNVAT